MENGMIYLAAFMVSLALGLSLTYYFVQHGRLEERQEKRKREIEAIGGIALPDNADISELRLSERPLGRPRPTDTSSQDFYRFSPPQAPSDPPGYTTMMRIVENDDRRVGWK